MQSRMRILGHPVHPMVVHFPIVIFPVLVGLDLIWAATHDAALWPVGGWLGMVGIGGGILAILTGTVDLAAIPGQGRAHQVALWHFVGGLAVQSLYILSVWSRWPVGSAPSHPSISTALDTAGLAVVVVQGYLGSELRTRHHIGVPDTAQGADPVTLKQ